LFRQLGRSILQQCAQHEPGLRWSELRRSLDAVRGERTSAVVISHPYYIIWQLRQERRARWLLHAEFWGARWASPRVGGVTGVSTRPALFSVHEM